MICESHFGLLNYSCFIIFFAYEKKMRKIKWVDIMEEHDIERATKLIIENDLAFGRYVFPMLDYETGVRLFPIMIDRGMLSNDVNIDSALIWCAIDCLDTILSIVPSALDNVQKYAKCYYIWEIMDCNWTTI